MSRARNRVVVYLETSGPATCAQIADAIGWQRNALNSALSKLRRLDQVHITGTDGMANIWDAGPGEQQQRPDPQEIVAAALANQPELARVWGRAA